MLRNCKCLCWCIGKRILFFNPFLCLVQFMYIYRFLLILSHSFPLSNSDYFFCLCREWIYRKQGTAILTGKVGFCIWYWCNMMKNSMQCRWHALDMLQMQGKFYAVGAWMGCIFSLFIDRGNWFCSGWSDESLELNLNFKIFSKFQLIYFPMNCTQKLIRKKFLSKCD